MKLKISPFAINDLEESFEYYNHKVEKLGNKFAEEVDNTFVQIKRNPKQFEKPYKEIRKALVNRFPFIIFFTIKNKTIYILAIFHSSRNPKIIKERYKSIN